MPCELCPEVSFPALRCGWTTCGQNYSLVRVGNPGKPQRLCPTLPYARLSPLHSTEVEPLHST